MDLADLAAPLLQQQRSTPDLIADALREAILRGIFREGEPLRQDEIAKQFNVSRIPVREAMRQLEAEGLLKFYPNRGAVVAALTPAEVQEIGEMRIVLETLALQLAIPHLTEADLHRADAALDATERTTDVARWAELNWEFHAALYTPADRPRLLMTIKTLHVNVDRYIRLQMEKMNYHARSQKEHNQILQACRDRNIKTATRQLKRHISTASQQLVVYLQQS